MAIVVKDPAGTAYFAVSSRDFPDEAPQWALRDFDATLFVSSDAKDDEIESAIDALLTCRPKWVFTTEPRSEYWHDVVDEKSVGLGLQEEIGAGEPMTVWFTEVTDYRDWRRSHNLGGAEFHLFLFVGLQEPLEIPVACLKRTIRQAMAGP